MKQQFSNKQCASALLAALLFGANPLQHAAAQTPNVSVSNTVDPLNPVIVTATRTPTKASDVLADNIYIGPEEIAQAGQTSLVELLQRQRGVEISTQGGAGSNASVFLRGTSGGQSLVLIDGIRTQSSLSGTSAWAAIPLSLIDHIEIIFGPQSSIYGSEAIGGVIQIFTKKGSGPFQAGGSAGYGSYGTSIIEGSIYGSIDGENKTRYSFSASQELSTGFNSVASNNPCNPNQPSSVRSSAFCSAGWSTSRTGYTKDSATGQISQMWAPGQEIGAQFLSSRLNNQYPATAYKPDYSDYAVINNRVTTLNTLAAYSKNQVTRIWNSLLQVAVSADNGQTLAPSSNAVANSKQNIYTWQNDIKLGSDLLQLVAERRSQSAFATSGNISQDQNTNSVAAAYQLKRGSNLASISFRNDNISGYGPQNTGSIAYGYFLTKEWRVNVNHGTAFKAPSFFDLYYPGYGVSSLQPEKSKNTEAGIFYETKSFDARVIAYSNTITNLIQYTSSGCPAGYSFGCAGNVANAKINGVSLGSTARLGNYALKASFDQQNPIDQSTGYVLAKRAKQFGNVGVERQSHKLVTGVESTLQGHRTDFDNTGNMSGYALLNLYASYQLEKDISLFARWNNVLNKDYQLSYGYNTPGSNVFVGMRYAMK
jgi:vitamin B12 transporter